MKFVHGLLVLTAIAALTASAKETAYEGQSIGSIAIVSSSPRTIVPVAFQELSAVDDQNVCISNILRTTNLLDGDQVFLYTSTGYQSWKLQDRQWVDNDATFVLEATGEQNSGVGAKADMTRVNVGKGFWLYRPDTTSGKRDYAKPFYIFGAYATTTKEVTVSAGKTLLGNPTITTKSPTITSPIFGDHLYIDENDGLKDYSYTKTGKWAHKEDGKLVTENNPPALAPGKGFWYTTNQPSVTFKW